MNRNILRLAVPNIISNITIPLLSMVDMAIVGHLESQNYIGAIATSAIIFNFIYWSFSFLRMGTSGFTAQAYGASNWMEAKNLLVRSLVIALFGAGIILFLQKTIFDLAFSLIKASEDVNIYASHYFFIYIWAAPAILSTYAFSGWFVGMQDAKTPMYIAISINLVNILLSFIFVYHFEMNLDGVALASTLAQYIGLFLTLLLTRVKYKAVLQNIDFGILRNIAPFIAFFKVNTDIFIRTLLLITVTTFFTSISAKSGDLILAANALLMQLFTLFSYIMDGFAYASEALTGKYIGARKLKDLDRLIRRLFLWGLSFALLFMILYFFFTDQIIGIMTNKQDVISLCNEYKTWMLLVPIAGFAAFLWDGVFIGATASTQMRNSMFVAALTFFAVYYSLFSSFGNNALWFAFVFYLAVRGVVQTCMYHSIKRRIIDQLI